MPVAAADPLDLGPYRSVPAARLPMLAWISFGRVSIHRAWIARVEADRVVRTDGVEYVMSVAEAGEVRRMMEQGIASG